MSEGMLVFGKGYVGGMFSARSSCVEWSGQDICDRAGVGKVLEEKRPEIVVNCAGKTGRPNIDWCENHKIETLASNVTGPLVLARECLDRDIFFAHVGSGCIYTGDNGGKGFTEDCEPNFFGSFYSRTKIWSESALSELPVLLLRLRMPMDGTPGPRNLISKLVSYREVIDVDNSVSVMDDFLDASMFLIEKRKTGIYNVVNRGAVRHSTILDTYRRIVDPSFSYRTIDLEELDRRVKAGRSNCVLDVGKLLSEGFPMPPVEESLAVILERYATRMKGDRI